MHGPNQLDVTRDDVQITADDLLEVPTGEITDTGLRHNIRVGIQYLAAWLEGFGCVPLYNLMEDAATAEICRSQIWQWIHFDVRTREGLVISEVFDDVLDQELSGIKKELGSARFASGMLDAAAKLFSDMAKKEEFDEFLTIPAYDYLP